MSELKDLYEKMKSLEEGTAPVVDAAEDNTWVANLINLLGGDWENLECRGSFYEVKLDEEPPNSGGGSPCEAGDEGDGGVCLNGGVCSVVDDQAVCDCSRTGFRGKDCSQGKAR